MKCDHLCQWSQGNICLLDGKTHQVSHLKGNPVVGSVIHDKLLHLAFSRVLACDFGSIQNTQLPCQGGSLSSF